MFFNPSLEHYKQDFKVLKVLLGVERSEISVISVIINNGFKTKIFSCVKQFFYMDRIFNISRFIMSFAFKNCFNNGQITVLLANQ